MPLNAKGQNLRLLVENHGLEFTCLQLGALLESGELKPEDFSLRELAEGLCGADWVRMLDPRQNGGQGGVVFLEAEGANVVSSAFANITGQIVYSKMLQDYQAEAFIGPNLVETIPTSLDGEKIPGMGLIPDEGFEVGEAKPYPETGFGEDYVETPKTTKRGMILSITKEAIFFDRTGLLLKRASTIGERLGMNKEKRILDMVVGATNSYKRKGTAANTYLLAADAGDWANKLASTELTDWTDVDASEKMFAEQTDDNGDPIVINANQILVMPYKKATAKRILSATEIREVTATNTTTVSGNPVAGQWQLFSSALAYQRVLAGVETTAAKAKLYWYHGDFKKAFAYMELWPLTVVQAADNADAEFERDVVSRFKASERGEPAVQNPRYVNCLYST